jgi:tyrosinase
MTMLASYDRRSFMTATGAVTLALALGGCEHILQEIARRPIRRNISGLAANDPILQAYRSAIGQMQALPASDQRNWSMQASIHNNTCPHATWYVLPWHRVYLWYFERICRSLSGEKSFAVPYWNWTEGSAVPDVFYAKGDVLNDTTKVLAQHVAIPAEFVSHSVLEGILEETNFLVFGSSKATTLRPPVGYGALEATPHNNVHSLIGGDMGTYMSPLDPVFWTHHAMMDYCWVDWNFDRNNQNPNDPSWMNFNFTGFVDENGAAVSLTAGLSQLLPIFDYQYEPSQIGTSVASMTVRTRVEAERLKAFVQTGGVAEFPVRQRFLVDRSQQVSVGSVATVRIDVAAEALRQAIASAATDRILLTLQRVEPPATSDFFVRVFVNAPETVSAETPITDAHYAGCFAFFLGGPAHADMGAAGYLVDVTSTLRRLGAPEHIDIQLVAVPYPGRTVAPRGFSVGGLELAVAQIATGPKK